MNINYYKFKFTVEYSLIQTIVMKVQWYVWLKEILHGVRKQK